MPLQLKIEELGYKSTPAQIKASDHLPYIVQSEDPVEAETNVLVRKSLKSALSWCLSNNNVKNLEWEKVALEVRGYVL